MLKTLAVAAALLALTGCTLYSEVTVSPLHINPSDIERGSDIQSMVRKADYLRAMESAATIDSRERKSATDLARSEERRVGKEARTRLCEYTVDRVHITIVENSL